MSNRAAYVAAKGAAAVVADAPMPKLKAGSVIVKNKAVAFNPIDWKMRDFGFMVPSWPTVFGLDAAGEIHAVDESISNQFKVGQRVFVRATGLLSQDTDQSAFQLYTAAAASQIAPLPDNITFEAAAALPLSISTAAAALYEQNALKLDLPTKPSPPAGKKAILVWGAASSVGCSAVQLAHIGGIKVIATASPKNFDLVKSLGADVVVDYRDPDVVDKTYAAFEGYESVGAFDSVGLNGDQCVEIVKRLGGGHVATVLPFEKETPEGVTIGQVQATSVTKNGISKVLFHDFLPKALAEGKFVPAPEIVVVGHGLENIEEGLVRLKAGVSAQKLVVAL